VIRDGFKVKDALMKHPGDRDSAITRARQEPAVSDGASIATLALAAQKPPKPRRAGRFVMIRVEDMETAAFRSLSCNARALMLELDRTFNGQNNGEIELPVSKAAGYLHGSKATALRAFNELEDRAFIQALAKGSFEPGAKKPTQWELTWRKLGDREPRRLFAAWKPRKPV